MRSRLTIGALPLVLFGAALGCSPTSPGAGVICTEIGVDALNVSVLDRASGERICDATVVAVEGAFSQQLSASASPPCGYSGPTERAGLYEVRASRAGYQTAVTSGVRVNRDQCHVIPVPLTVTLAR